MSDFAAGDPFDPDLDEMACWRKFTSTWARSSRPRPAWSIPTTSGRRGITTSRRRIAQAVLIEYTAHPEACFHLGDGLTIPVAQLEARKSLLRSRWSPRPRSVSLCAWWKGAAASQCRSSSMSTVRQGSICRRWIVIACRTRPGSRITASTSATWAAFRLFRRLSVYSRTYPSLHLYSRRDDIDLPLGRVYVEVSKGFEMLPVRQVFVVTPRHARTDHRAGEGVALARTGLGNRRHARALPSPISALLEGAAEGVNVVNLLASQWGELMTNVGDFDGKTTWGSREAGGDGEYLVRVGTENRQHVLGHISLLGYDGR